MKSNETIVTKIPMSVIWNINGIINAKRECYLSFDDLRSMLSQNALKFVVANIGMPLKWVSLDKCFQFWKSEVKTHLVSDPNNRFSLDDFPDEYAYIASKWSDDLQADVVLLEMHH